MQGAEREDTQAGRGAGQAGALYWGVGEGVARGWQVEESGKELPLFLAFDAVWCIFEGYQDHDYTGEMHACGDTYRWDGGDCASGGGGGSPAGV